VLPAQAEALAPSAVTDLRINEFMATNQSVLEDPAEPGEFPDWIEIYNPTGAAVSLNGLALTDDLEEPNKFPITNGLSIPAGGFVIFYADNDPKQGPFHTDFGLSAGGEDLALVRLSDRLVIDKYTFGAQTPDVSMGRSVDGAGSWVSFNVPTPSRSNSLNPPIISHVGHAPAIPAAGEAVTVSALITDNGVIVSASVAYSVAGVAQTPVPMTANGTTYVALLPGHANGVLVDYHILATDDGGNPSRFPASPGRVLRYLVGYQPPVIVINEVVVENNGFLTDANEPSDTPDYLELYNPGNSPINLATLSLSDNPNEPDKYLIPSSVNIAAGGYLLFLADNDPEQGPLHTNFALEKNGESVLLYGGFGTTVIDSYSYTNTNAFGAGRFPNGSGPFTGEICPTPGKVNFLCDQRTYLPTVKR
jgi:hypothetical protein